MTLKNYMLYLINISSPSSTYSAGEIGVNIAPFWLKECISVDICTIKPSNIATFLLSLSAACSRLLNYFMHNVSVIQNGI